MEAKKPVKKTKGLKKAKKLEANKPLVKLMTATVNVTKY
jgi:hypothetical protein